MAFAPTLSPVQCNRLRDMIRYLKNENPEQFHHLPMPDEAEMLKRLWRSLVNLRPPMEASDEYLQLEDAFLQDNLSTQEVTHYQTIPESKPGIRLWRGDITLLQADGIVNAANSGMTGCYAPCHGCIDNVIHTFAGIRLRLACHQQMESQGFPEPTGQAKITPGFNLPAKHVLHTVGPIISRPLTHQDEELLAACYTHCLDLSALNGLKSIAFPCISTGEFHFPKHRAAEIAFWTVQDYLQSYGTSMNVIFNVFTQEDHEIYAEILG